LRDSAGFAPDFAALHRPGDMCPTWRAYALGPAAIGELKAKPGGELQVHGSGAAFTGWVVGRHALSIPRVRARDMAQGRGVRPPRAGPTARTQRDGEVPLRIEERELEAGGPN
jgi:hypothetical protein